MEINKASSGPHQHWLLKNNGQVLGVLDWDKAADECQIIDLKIEEAFRRKGLASKLLAELVACAKSAQARKIFLEVRASNLAAQALYIKQGFRLSGRRKDYYSKPKEDALLLEMLIQP